MSGLAVATELRSLCDADVTVVEAGPVDGDTRHLYERTDTASASKIAWQPSDDPDGWRPWRSDSASHYGPETGLRRRLGGRSLYWTGVLVRVEPWALADWPRSVRDDLERSWRGGPSLYDRTEAKLAAWVGDVEASGVGSVAGHRFTQPFCAIRPLPDGRWTAYTPLREALADPGIRFVGGARVRAIVEHADGLHVHTDDGATEPLLRCDVVCLAAGTLESTRIAGGFLGTSEFTGLNDHHIHGLMVPLPAGHPVDLAPGSLYWRPASGDARWNTYARLRNDLGSLPLLDVWTLGEQLPSEDRSVVLVESGCVEIRPRPTAVDVDLIERVWSWLSELGGRLGVEVKPGSPDSDLATAHAVDKAVSRVESGQAGLVSRPLGAVDHEAGTLALGAVVEEDGELAKGSGIFVVGPATFPRSGAANPSLTILALAARSAAAIAERLA
jgi:choline dehydrogenase-like flavoprotein